MQRLASSVAIAVFGSMNTVTGDQILADRGALTGANPYTAAQWAGGGQPGGPSSGLLGTYQALTAQVTTETYANGFFVVAVLGVAGALLAVFMRSGQPRGGGHGAVEV